MLVVRRGRGGGGRTITTFDPSLIVEIVEMNSGGADACGSHGWGPSLIHAGPQGQRPATDWRGPRLPGSSSSSSRSPARQREAAGVGRRLPAPQRASGDAPPTDEFRATRHSCLGPSLLPRCTRERASLARADGALRAPVNSWPEATGEGMGHWGGSSVDEEASGGARTEGESSTRSDLGRRGRRPWRTEDEQRGSGARGRGLGRVVECGEAGGVLGRLGEAYI